MSAELTHYIAEFGYGAIFLLVFFQELGVAEHPDHLELCQRVLAVPFKRARSRPVEYLEFDEIQAVLAAIDRTTAHGRRDYTLLATMFNTGARVQEIITVRVIDVRLQTPPHVRLFGKGRKERVCPLWTRRPKFFVRWWPKGATANCPKIHFSVTTMDPASPGSAFDTSSENTVHGPKWQDPHWRASAYTPTACAIAQRYICCAPGSTSSQSASGLSTPMSPQRTGYATTGLEMKRKAIEQAHGIAHTMDDGAALWRTDASILAWLGLEAL